MREGTLIDYKLQLFGVHAAGRHVSQSGIPSSFVDKQVRSPYRLWSIPTDSSKTETIIEDVVRYTGTVRIVG